MLINRNKYGFTLIEVLVASMILAVVVFGILRLMNNNSKQGINIEKNNEMYDVYNNSLECIKSFGFNYLSGVTSAQSVNFGSNYDSCLTGSYDNNLSFSGVEIKSYFDGQPAGSNNYWIYFTTNTGSNFVDINTHISNGTITKNFNYKMYK